MASSKVPPGDSDAFLAMMRTQSCPVGADYVSWLNGLCVGWQERRAATGLAVPPPAPTPAPEAPAHARRGDTLRVTVDSFRVARKGETFVASHVDAAGFAWEGRMEFGAPPTAYEIVTKGPLWPATPAPEAKRPEWVRIVKSYSPSRFKDGDVLRVVKWVDEVPAVDVDGYDVSGYVLYDSKWAPAPCPPPVAGRGEALPEDVRDFLLDVEYAAKWANQPQGPTVEYVKGRLKELAALAHDILSRPVRP